MDIIQKKSVQKLVAHGLNVVLVIIFMQRVVVVILVAAAVVQMKSAAVMYMNIPKTQRIILSNFSPDFTYCENCGEADRYVQRFSVSDLDPLKKQWLHEWCRVKSKRVTGNQRLNRWMLWLENKYNTSVFDVGSMPQIELDIAIEKSKRGLEPPEK